ncbi:GTP pyrophosphokinase family protein [Peribacillus simplex]|uniref:GTP pyrophosphokinase family protein n=1 Tax=Peribacillus simplex TaxID=1478 RepID=A0AAW7I7D8_9BACI|nr:GTP pyrophosphokinase [Peribacillus simplex]MDF9759550.1 putative GTP pyrophosphokinase [Peribacillus simplex]MDM5293060.1 GTP pyrophosphokinase family protein [Peribacillus simplex]MDM5451968.1 GTP pyrophosphokinase family protein [Peribacillus simplex]
MLKKKMKIEVIQKVLDNWRGFFLPYQMALHELESDFKVIDLEWKTQHGYSPIEHMKTRMKKLSSLVEKIQKKEIPLTQEAVRNEIRDILGVRIVTSFIDDVYMLKEHIEQREDIRMIRVKDYIQDPKMSGYKSLHLIVETQVILSNEIIWVPAEIQIRTSAMDFWASTEHKLNYKYQGETIPEDAQKQLIELAKASSLMDKEMSRLRTKLLAN